MLLFDLQLVKSKNFFTDDWSLVGIEDSKLLYAMMQKTANVQASKDLFVWNILGSQLDKTHLGVVNTLTEKTSCT